MDTWVHLDDLPISYACNSSANPMLVMFVTNVEENLMSIEAAATISSRDVLGFPDSSDIVI